MNDELKPKRPNDSRSEKMLHFSGDPALRESWVNVFGDVRFGKLLEELDTMAGYVSNSHADGFGRGLAVVTAACDRIDLLTPLPSDADLRLQGSVNWVGRSSMEVGMRIESRQNGKFQLAARAYFIMVARHEEDAAEVAPLTVESDVEKRRFSEAVARQKERKTMAQQNYLKSAPSAEESERLHQLFLDVRTDRIDGICMADSRRQNTALMHPQYRNAYYKIFGGYLMRASFELAFNTAYLFCKHRPVFINVDHMYFYSPVEIGSIVSFTSVVVYTRDAELMVEVEVEVIDPKTGQKNVTNVCYFSFVAIDDDGRQATVPNVLPHTYEEGLKFLDGEKRYRSGREIRSAKGDRFTQ